jgi:2,3,4,5-tetrahydropyridine-2-carboxylate N-succinyltransferase
VKLPIEAHGVVQQDENGLLSVRYTKFQTSTADANKFSLDDKGTKSTKIITHLVEDKPIEDIPTAWLKLYLLSLRFFKPNELNFENIFSVLPNIAWTNKGPLRAEALESIIADEDFKLCAIDKFPPMTDYIVPKGVRIADSSRVRLGAYLGEGTTIMHEGFVNFNAGSLGEAMIEGRISQGVVIGDKTDIGGGASTMGTLSGGNDVRISLGKNCLLGANSGLGIPLGDRCTVEAGLYLTASSKVEVINDKGEISETVKASELASKSDLLFIRNSLTGSIQCRPNKKVIELNEELHSND